MKNLRVGLVGFGSMGRNHARILNNLEGVELVGICDPIIEKDINFAQKYFCKEVGQLLNLNLDYCVISTPTTTHHEIAQVFLSRKIPVLIEKPVTENHALSLELLNLSENTKTIVAVGHIERFNSALIELKRRLDSNQLGRIYQISTRRMGPFPSRISDVGVIKDLATHDFDLTAWLFGCDYDRIFAEATRPGENSHEDLVSVTGKLSNGVIVNHLVNWISPTKERSVLVTGEKGSFYANTLTGELTLFSAGSVGVTRPELAHFVGTEQGEVHTYAFEKPEPLLVEHIAFRDAIQGKDSNYATLASAVKTMAVAEAVVVSSRDAEAVKILY
jgi:UDP-N-acetylglucosamine 3-dehydrogenase